jgi:hypothetical protein
MTLEETSDFEVWPKFAATRKSRSRTKGAAKNAKANAKRLEIQGMETCNWNFAMAKNAKANAKRLEIQGMHVTEILESGLVWTRIQMAKE